MRIQTWMLYFGVLCCYTASLSFFQSIVIESETGEYVLLRSDGVKRTIPDLVTARIIARELNVEFDTVDIHTLDSMSSYKVGGSTPSLIIRNESSDEERLRVFSQLIEILEYPTYWLESHKLVGIRNPSIAVWDGSPLIAWRGGVFYYRSFIQFGWLAPNMSVIDNDANKFGLHRVENMTLQPVEYADGGRSQEDPRLLVLSDSRLIVTFVSLSGKSTKVGVFRQCYAVGTINKQTNLVEFSPSIELKHPVARLHEKHQKSWMPFEYDGELYLIVSICPLIVIKVVGGAGAVDGIVEVVDGNFDSEAALTESGKLSFLPWDHYKYGLPRGGTPMVKVRGVYVGFFHTRLRHRTPNDASLYLMGVMVMTTVPPFVITKISRVPIMKFDGFYTGNKMKKRVDHVVFPSGLNLDSDGDHLWVSFGHQDQDSYIAKFHVEGLLQSLEDYAGS